MTNVRTDTGYDNVLGRLRPDPRHPNGWLRYNGDEVKLWVFDVVTAFRVSGSRAQSQRTRTFFARNFVQPSFTVACQFPSQRHMADAAEFVRTTHLGMESSTRLQIIGSNLPVLRGSHSRIDAEGYIKSIPREHMKENFAPELRFDFVIERFYQPSGWADTPVKIRKLKSWHDIIEGVDQGEAFTSTDAPSQYIPTHPNGAGQQFGGPAGN